MSIPIGNLFYLYAYAWDLWPQVEEHGVSPGEIRAPVDLLALLLLREVDGLVRRGLDQTYGELEEEVECLRGRVLIASLARSGRRGAQRLPCRYAELSHDSRINRVIRGTLNRLRYTRNLDAALHADAARLFRRLRGIGAPEVTVRDCRAIQLHRNTRCYRKALQLCALLAAGSFLSEDTGEWEFEDVRRDPKRLHRVFERFVLRFLQRELNGWSVGRSSLSWHDVQMSPEDAGFLPRMFTDVTLRRGDRTVVIDTKYYTSPLGAGLRGPRIRSPHLYQLFAYLRNLAAQADPQHRVDGMLLYPAVGEDLHLRYEMFQHMVEVRTVNLAAPWEDIRTELLALVS